MKKGFTLIELLIVMVIVGILTTVALPKYRTTLERGRSVEAIENLKTASEIMNANYVINNNAYTYNGITDSSGNFLRGDFAHPRYFSAPVLQMASFDTANATISLARDNNIYELEAVNQDGELKYISCTGNTTLCESIGMESDGSTYKMDFQN